MVTIIARTREELIEQLELYNALNVKCFDDLADVIIKFGVYHCIIGKFEDTKGNAYYKQVRRLEYYSKDKKI